MSNPRPLFDGETLGQHCARWIKSAKKKHMETNTVLTWAEIAKIIDSTAEGLAYFSHSKAQKSEVPDKPTPESIYEAYPRKVGRKAAIDAITRAIKRIGAEWKQVDHLSPNHLLLDKVKVYASYVALWPADERNYVPHPTTWFNQGRYDDDPKEWERGKPIASAPKDYSKLG